MLGIIIVAYKNPKRTAAYIKEQLANLINLHVVVVVNNASTYEECDALAAEIGGQACSAGDYIGKYGSYVVHSPENLGFAKGNNLGVEFLTRNNPCEYILFSNDDILLSPQTDLSPMMEKLESDPSIGAIGPAVIGLDGQHQSPHRRVITAYRQIGWLLLSRFRKRSKSENPVEIEMPQEGVCYWVSGAFFMMKFSDFKEVDGFDSDTFLYGEEPILAERLKKIGKTMFYYPCIQITHLEGSTTKASLHSSKLYRYLVESNCIYYRKYLGTSRIVVSLYKWLNLRHV